MFRGLAPDEYEASKAGPVSQFHMATRTGILLMLALHKLPHPSTIRKFAKRISGKVIDNFKYMLQPSLNIMAEYDKFARQYAERLTNKEVFNYNTHIEITNMFKILGSVKNKIVLDLGCGFGDHTQKYIKRGAQKVYGIDISKELIQLAKKRKIPKTEFSIHDLNKKLKFSDHSFDIVTASLSIHYVKDLNKLLKEIYRVLKSSGIFCFSIPNPVMSSGERKFNTTNYDFIYLLGVCKKKNKKRKLFGDYFSETLRKEALGPKQIVTIKHRTYQSYIQLLTKTKFKIIDYLDCKPVPSSRKLSKTEFERCMKIPTFCIFKVGK